LTLADAIRVSSNIAIVKFAARLTPAEQYRMLRDFGFGALTGIEFPGEAAGKLRPPSEWTRPSAASLAIGYELSVTPIQVAAAYAALANGGLLLQPTLIREVRSPEGPLLYRHEPEPVTRSMLEQALAARTVALDRARLSTAAPPTAAVPLEADGGVVPYVVPWPYRPDSAVVRRRQAVPDVTGLRLREAVRALHRRGFRVALKGWGTAEHTWPAAGDSAALGATVTLFAEPVSPTAISALARRRAKR